MMQPDPSHEVVDVADPAGVLLTLVGEAHPDKGCRGHVRTPDSQPSRLGLRWPPRLPPGVDLVEAHPSNLMRHSCATIDIRVRYHYNGDVDASQGCSEAWRSTGCCRSRLSLPMEISRGLDARGSSPVVEADGLVIQGEHRSAAARPSRQAGRGLLPRTSSSPGDGPRHARGFESRVATSSSRVAGRWTS